MKSNDLFFHETFQPEIKYISEILRLASDSFYGNKFDISDITGIPTGKEKGKVEPHIRYAKYMGLIDFSYDKGMYTLSLTEIGKEVFFQDRYLHETLSLWLMHYGLSSNKGAPQWMFLIRSINKGFNSKITSSQYTSQIEKAFEIYGNDISKYFGVLKNAYISGMFEKLGYLSWDEGIVFNEKYEEYDLAYLYAYILFDSWDYSFPEKNEITFTEIVEELKYGKILGLNDETIDSILNTLEELNVVRINRQLFPVTIIRLIKTQNIIKEMYSLLL